MDKRRAVFYAPGKQPMQCEKCGAMCKPKAQGTYECEKCGELILDDYGKVRKYLEEYGNASAIIIAEATGVAVPIIQSYLKEGRLEIPNGSNIYIKCQKCYTDIRFGMYCPMCASQLSKDLQGTLHLGNIGETPKDKTTGKMRYFNNK